MAMLWLFLIIISSVWIKYACDPFEESADYLGRNLGHGIKGATINAVGSSLPELFVTVICLFVFKDTAGFSSGIATSAGSAVFNAAVIPAAVLLVISFKLKIDGIKIKKRVIIRDGLFYVISIGFFIGLILQPLLTWWMGAILIGIYLLYSIMLIQWQKMIGNGDNDEEEEDDNDEVAEHSENRFIAFLKLDFKTFVCGNGNFTDGKAWIALILATLHIGAACFLLSHAIIELAHVWGINTFFVAVILAAAATSVPDTIISVKDAIKGNYEDAIANAIGSNIFDICIGLGLPLLIYTLIYGPLQIRPENSAGIFDLIVILMFITILVLALFLFPKKVGGKTALVLIVTYIGYAVFAISSGLGFAWATQISHFLRGIAGL